MDERIPPYLRQRLCAVYGQALAEEIAGGFDVRRPVTLRVNPLRGEGAAVRAELDAAGLRWAQVGWYEDALILPEATLAQVECLEAYKAGKIYLQSLSAMLPPLMLSLEGRLSVLDMAAAPGGKTTQMAALSAGRAAITACECDAGRLERLRHNLELQGVRQVNLMRLDARQLDEAFRFDRVLLDAPCTGSGTLLLSEPPRRMEEGWVQKRCATQLALLKKGLRLLARGGELVYSTCSILPEENENIVRAALPGSGARLAPLSENIVSQVPCLPTTLPQTLCVRPTSLYEGFFVARLVKD